MTKRIAAFAGSTSSTSINKQLASCAANYLKSTSFDVLDLNDYEVPIYSEDLEKKIDYPRGAKLFNDALDCYDGFIISLAEHNGSYASSFKNLFDWVSRQKREVFRNKPVLVMATSPGARGGATVLASALATFPHMGATIVGDFTLGKFYDNFKEGSIVLAEKKEELQTLVYRFENNI